MGIFLKRKKRHLQIILVINLINEWKNDGWLTISQISLMDDVIVYRSCLLCYYIQILRCPSCYWNSQRLIFRSKFFFTEIEFFYSVPWRCQLQPYLYRWFLRKSGKSLHMPQNEKCHDRKLLPRRVHSILRSWTWWYIGIRVSKIRGKDRDHSQVPWLTSQCRSP